MLASAGFELRLELAERDGHDAVLAEWEDSRVTTPIDLDRYTGAIVAAIDDVFDHRCVGVWLLGSHAYGGATPASDIDVQACVRTASRTGVRELADRIAHPRLPCPAAGLEFVLYDVDEVRSPEPPLQWLLNLNGGPQRERRISTNPASESWHWFVLDLAIGRQTARTLAGQDLSEVVGPIDRDTQARAIAESLRWHQVHDDGNPNQVGNAARGMRFLQTGEWGSKPDGLAWAHARGLEHSQIVRQLTEALEDEHFIPSAGTG